MDPQACLKEILAAVREGQLEEAQYRLYDLATWIERGGYCPITTPDMFETIIRARRMMLGGRS